MSSTRRAVLRTAATAAGVALAGCGDGGDGEDGTPTATATPRVDGPTVTVRLFQSQFSPRTLSIETDTTVRWENTDSYAHTITAASDNWSFDVEVPEDATASHTFREAGQYDVYCRFHGSESLTGMSMRIAVGEATAVPPEG